VSRKTKSVTLDGGVEIHSTELEFCDATDLMTDLIAAIAPAAGSFQAGIAHMGDAAGQICRELAAGRLTTYLARVLAGTTLIVKGDKLKVDLINSRDKLNLAFSGRQKLVAPAVELAWEVSFADFLGVLAELSAKIQKRSPSATSSESTESTG
jgi:hypothetical protein